MAARIGMMSCARRLLGCVLLSAPFLFRALPAHGQPQHTVGLAVTMTCPVNADNGSKVTCTVTVENMDGDHGVAKLALTKQMPFPGGTTTAITGCAASLAPND